MRRLTISAKDYEKKYPQYQVYGYEETDYVSDDIANNDLLDIDQEIINKLGKIEEILSLEGKEVWGITNPDINGISRIEKGKVSAIYYDSTRKDIEDEWNWSIDNPNISYSFCLFNKIIFLDRESVEKEAIKRGLKLE